MNNNNTESVAIVNYLENANTTFIKDEGGFISVKVDDKLQDRVIFSRAFPLSHPDEYITIYTVNEKNEPDNEIGIIRDIRTFDKDKVQMISSMLDIRYFTPCVTRIFSLKDEYGYIYINVRTTAGDKNIVTNNNSGSFVKLSDTRILIIDVDGNRYDIPDVRLLDSKSRKLISMLS